MLRKTGLFLIFFGFILNAGAQNPVSEFKIGFLSPSDAEQGLFFGVNSGRMIDEAMSYSFSLDFYSSSYEQTMNVAVVDGGTGTPGETEVATLIDNSSLYIPLMIRLNYERNLPSGFVIRGSGGIGYAFMWVTENNYEIGIEETRFYSGLNYRFSAGAGIQISSTANLILDLEYNGGEVSRSKGETAAGLPVRSNIDMSGFGLRIGVSIFDLGF